MRADLGARERAGVWRRASPCSRITSRCAPGAFCAAISTRSTRRCRAGSTSPARALAQLEPDSAETTALRDTIRGICERADRVAGACALDGRDLRGWHYVLTGGLVLHQSPYGFDEPMHGRYAWLADSLPRVATGLDRLAALVAPLALPCIYAPPGRDHEIVAHAASHRLGIPVAPWPAVGVPAPGLVVMYDLAELPSARHRTADPAPPRSDRVRARVAVDHR